MKDITLQNSSYHFFTEHGNDPKCSFKVKAFLYILFLSQSDKPFEEMMTANVFQEDIDKCHAAGMDSRIGKPIDSINVLLKLCKYLT